MVNIKRENNSAPRIRSIPCFTLFSASLSLSKFPPILVCTIALHLLINLALKRESQQLSWIPLAHASSPLRNRVDLHPRTSNFEAASQDDACTNMIALEA